MRFMLNSSQCELYNWFFLHFSKWKSKFQFVNPRESAMLSCILETLQCIFIFNYNLWMYVKISLNCVREYVYNTLNKWSESRQHRCSVNIMWKKNSIKGEEIFPYCEMAPKLYLDQRLLQGLHHMSLTKGLYVERRPLIRQISYKQQTSSCMCLSEQL